jgi:hypothetical protein
VKVCEVSSSGPGDTELIREFIRELSAVSVMRHPNVVKLLGASLKPPKCAQRPNKPPATTALWNT